MAKFQLREYLKPKTLLHINHFFFLTMMTDTNSVFSLNFTSADKGPFMTVRQKICARSALPWGEGGG